MIFEKEEYQKGSDYSSIFKDMFDGGIKTKVRYEKHTFLASRAKKSQHYVVSKPSSWLHASKKWLLGNGYIILGGK